MEPKYEEMEGGGFRRGKDVAKVETLREWKKVSKHIRKLLLANAFWRSCGTTEFTPGSPYACATVECSSRTAAGNAESKSRSFAARAKQIVVIAHLGIDTT